MVTAEQVAARVLEAIHSDQTTATRPGSTSRSPMARASSGTLGYVTNAEHRAISAAMLERNGAAAKARYPERRGK